MGIYDNPCPLCDDLFGSCNCGQLCQDLDADADPLDEQPTDGDGFEAVGNGANGRNPINITRADEVHHDGSEGEDNNEHQQAFEEQEPENNSASEVFNRIQDADNKGRIHHNRFHGVDGSNLSDARAENQLSSECHYASALFRKDDLCFDRSLDDGLGSSSSMGFHYSSRDKAIEANFFAPTGMGVPGDDSHCDFTQESADFNSLFNLDHIDDAFVPPVTGASNDLALPPGFPDRLYNGIETNHFPNSLNMSGPGFMDATTPRSSEGDLTLASLAQPQDEIIFSGFGSGHILTSSSFDEPLIRTPQEAQPDLHAWYQKKAQLKAATQAKIGTVKQVGQELFQVHAQNPPSAYCPSTQAAPILPTPPSNKKLSANQLGKQPVPQPISSSPVGSTSSKHGRSADIHTSSKSSKRARTDASLAQPFRSEVEADSARGRSVPVLFKTRWEHMTQIEKARILLPMILGKHPIEFEKEEMQRGLSYGTMRQREALNKTVRMNAEAVTEAQTAAATLKEMPVPGEINEDEELAALKARMAEIEAGKKKKANEEKKKRANDKRAATMRAKRQAQKEVERRKREQLAEEQRRATEEQALQQLLREHRADERAYAHVGFAAAQPYEA